VGLDESINGYRARENEVRNLQWWQKVTTIPSAARFFCVNPE